MIYEDRMTDKQSALLKQYTKYPPVNIRGLAKALDIEVTDDDTLTVNGYITAEGDNKYTIRVNTNKKHPLGQQNFTIAHEIAHFLLHKDFLDKKGQLDRDTERPGLIDIEVQANTLAAAILMPEDIVNDLIMNDDIKNTKELAERLQVPEFALRIQIGMPVRDTPPNK